MSRADKNAITCPSGDQVGERASWSPRVSWWLSRPSTRTRQSLGSSQRVPHPAFRDSSTCRSTHRPSGDNLGVPTWLIRKVSRADSTRRLSWPAVGVATSTMTNATQARRRAPGMRVSSAVRKQTPCINCMARGRATRRVSSSNPFWTSKREASFYPVDKDGLHHLLQNGHHVGCVRFLRGLFRAGGRHGR